MIHTTLFPLVADFAMGLCLLSLVEMMQATHEDRPAPCLVRQAVPLTTICLELGLRLGDEADPMVVGVVTCARICLIYITAPETSVAMTRFHMMLTWVEVVLLLCEMSLR